MRGTSMSNTACRNGSAAPVTTSATTGASHASASPRIAPTKRSSTSPGGSDTGRTRPSRPVISASSAAPGATLRYQTKFISRSARPVGPGMG